MGENTDQRAGRRTGGAAVEERRSVCGGKIGRMTSARLRSRVYAGIFRREHGESDVCSSAITFVAGHILADFFLLT